MENYERIIDHLAPIVEKLELWNIKFSGYFSTATNHSRTVSFAKLKTLNFHFVAGSQQLLAVLIGHHNCLKELIISTDESLEPQDREDFFNMIENLFKLNTKVKHLTLSSSEISKSISSLTMIQLESLKIYLIVDEESNKSAAKFIKAQSHLKNISINFNFFNSDIFTKIWKSMQGCEIVELLNVTSNFNSNDLKVKPTITNLKVTGELIFINGFFGAIPNLEILRVGRLTDDVITYAAYSLKSLKVIEFALENGQVENYNEMKQYENVINKNIILRHQTVNDFLRGENN